MEENTEEGLLQRINSGKIRDANTSYQVCTENGQLLGHLADLLPDNYLYPKLSEIWTQLSKMATDTTLLLRPSTCFGGLLLQ